MPNINIRISEEVADQLKETVVEIQQEKGVYVDVTTSTIIRGLLQEFLSKSKEERIRQVKGVKI